MEQVQQQQQQQQPTGIRDAIRDLRKKLGLKERISQGLKEDVIALTRDLDLKEITEATDKVKNKDWKWPFKWMSSFKSSRKKANNDKIVFIYLNCKTGVMESPKLLPYISNMVIYNNRPYNINPKAIWTINSGLKQYKVYLYKDYDRRPISSDDYEETIANGFGTEDDELLIKAALEARVNKVNAQVGKAAIVIGILLVVGVIVYFIAR